MKTRLVKDWMTENVVTIAPDASVQEAHQLMREKSVRRLPVVKKGKLVGLLSLGDVREATHDEAHLKVREVMAQNVVAVGIGDTIKTAAMLMYTNKIGALPVIDNHDQLVGIITESDIFKVLIMWFSEEEANA
ncbi:MAG TPA: CBS domain-containing protein [Anaerolineales bacterium]|nr:CBS domain-containing protein [Anaerolineales bacterium]